MVDDAGTRPRPRRLVAAVALSALVHGLCVLLVVFDVLGAVLSFIGLVSGIFNVVGWVFVVAFVVIGVPHGYWGFIRPAGHS